MCLISRPAGCGSAIISVGPQEVQTMGTRERLLKCCELALVLKHLNNASGLSNVNAMSISNKNKIN